MQNHGPQEVPQMQCPGKEQGVCLSRVQFSPALSQKSLGSENNASRNFPFLFMSCFCGAVHAGAALADLGEIGGQDLARGLFPIGF